MATRRSFIAEGWIALHAAILESGGEVDYFQEGPSRRTSYIDSDVYRALAAPLLELSGIDPESLGRRSSTVKAALWRWIRKTAIADAYPLWKHLIGLRSRIALVAAVADAGLGRHLHDAPKYSPGNPASVARYGHWLVCTAARRGNNPILAILYGLALIGATWGTHLRCGFCGICFRRARPGGVFCDFHAQRGVTSSDRSAAFLRYRKGRLVKKLAETRGLSDHFRPYWAEVLISQRLALPSILFPHKSASERDWDWLNIALSMSPQVVQRIGTRPFSSLSYTDFVSLLVERIDPYEWHSSACPLKILNAEIWFALEEEVAPGKRGKGRKTAALVRTACRLATSGVRNGDIATRLSVAPSTVSRWLKRYPEFAEACRLR